jgi:hypothetical protein
MQTPRLKPRLQLRILQTLKVVWVLVALLALLAYIQQNGVVLLAQFERIAPLQWILSLTLLIIGRLLITVMAQQALAAFDHRIPFVRVFAMLASSELAKYLPGGIWHFVGRAAYYRAELIAPVTLTRILILENLWLVLSALITGAGLLIASTPQAGLVIILILIWLQIIRLSNRNRPLHESLLTLACTIGIWGLIGASFAAITPLSLTNAAYGMGTFVLAWLAGFLTLFAPGGIGIREALLTALLLPLIPPQDALALAITHRFLWIIVELLLGLAVWAIQRPQATATE